MKATWSEDSDCNSNDEEKKVANMCFVAIESRNEVYSSDNETNPFYDELNDRFESLYDEFKRLGSKYNSLKKMHANLKNENNGLLKNVIK